MDAVSLNSDSAALGRSVHLPGVMASLNMQAMQLTSKLSFVPQPTQRQEGSNNPENSHPKMSFSSPRPASTDHLTPMNWLMSRQQKALRIQTSELPSQQTLRDSKPYGQALRAAEMVAWNASGKFMLLAIALMIFLISKISSTAAEAAAPQLLAPVIQPNGQPLLRLNGSVGSNYVIEASSDLLVWEKLHAGTAVNGQLQFVHANFGNAPRMFYRGRVALPGEVANAFSVIPHLDTNQTVSALITTNGGLIKLTNHAGVVFELNIAPRALLTDEVITLTAITNIGNLPFAASPVGAVMLQPDGLLLLEPTTLTIRAANINSNAVTSFTFGEEGEEFYLLPDAPTNTTVTTWLTRLGGVGVVNASRAEVKEQLERLPTSSAAQLAQTLAGVVLQERMVGATPALVTHAEADQTLLNFYTNHIAAVFAAEGNSNFSRQNTAASTEPEIVLESITIFRDGVVVHHERFPQPSSEDAALDELLAALPSAVYLDSCIWAKSRVTQLAAQCGQHNANQIAEMLVLADWVDFQCPDDSVLVRAQLSDCLRFSLNFDSHIVTVAGPVTIESKVSAKNLPLRWQGGKTFSGTGTVSYDSFSMTPPPGPCWRDSIEFRGGLFHILSLEFDLNFKKKKQPRLVMKYISPSATESWVDHCPSPLGVIDIPTPEAVMWLGAFIVGHEPDFAVTGWKFPGGSKFATREYLQANVRDDALITEASNFELIHTPL